MDPQPPTSLLLTLLEQHPDGLLVTAPDGTVRFANGAAAALLGRRREELVGGRAPELPRDAGPRTVELADPQGGARVVQVCWQETCFEGAPARLATLRDATSGIERQTLERSAQARQRVFEELRELAALKSQIIEVVAHELRTPMTVLRSSLGLLLDGSLGELSGQQLEFLQLMQRNLDRLNRFSTDVLSLSRLESGHLTVRCCELTLPEALSPTLALLQVAAHDRGVRLEVPDEAAPPLRLFADPDALSQVVFNLVQNAITHCPPGTKVVFSYGPLDQDLAELSVADDGPGIPQGDLPRIFERFYQVNRAHGPGYRGTGIGLAVCQGLVERMGGKIMARSQLGQGTTFRFLLPSRPRAQGQEVRFGQLALFMGHVSPEQLQQALQEQAAGRRDKKIGEILLERGHLTPGGLQQVLATQESAPGMSGPRLRDVPGDARLGNLASHYGFIDAEQLEEAVCIQATLREGGKDIKLGEVFVQKKYMRSEDVIMVLHMQRQVEGRGQGEPQACCPDCGVPLQQAPAPAGSLRLDLPPEPEPDP